MNLLTDFHHNSLLRSLVLLFEKRLDIDVYRPIGLDWYHEGFWAINDNLDTAKQFLDIKSSTPADKTPPLNIVNLSNSKGISHVFDPGYSTTHKAILLNSFKEMKFDYVLASIPQHIPLFQKLIEKYQPQAKLIVQIGNNWPSHIVDNLNVLASVKPGSFNNSNVVYYHQEFDIEIFKPIKVNQSNNISSYINILQNMKQGWSDFLGLEHLLMDDIYFKSYGGQCRDGSIAGSNQLAKSMQDNDFIFHVKDGGDGYGHILYNAYACGKPVIIRSSMYENCLGNELFNENNCIDLDKMSIEQASNRIKEVCSNKEILNEMSIKAYESFNNNVDFAFDAEKVRNWLGNL